MNELKISTELLAKRSLMFYSTENSINTNNFNKTTMFSEKSKTIDITGESEPASTLSRQGLVTMPRPMRRNFNSVSPSKLGWYRVEVHCKEEYSCENVFELLRSAVSPETIRIYYKYEEHSKISNPMLHNYKFIFGFFVNRYVLAQRLLQASDLLVLPSGSRIRLIIKPGEPDVVIDEAYKMRLVKVLTRRYEPQQCKMNLSCFHVDEEWEHEFCALKHYDCLKAVIDLMGQFMPNVHFIQLDSNYLKDLSALNDIELLLPGVENISLEDNDLSDPQMLSVFKNLPLTRIWLKRNPFTSNFRERTKLKRILLEWMPRLHYMDKQSVTDFVERQESSLLKVPAEVPRNRSFTEEFPVTKENVHALLLSYLKAFDSPNRGAALRKFYMDTARIALSASKENANLAWLKPYCANSRRIQEVRDHTNIQWTCSDASQMFLSWPKTVHLKEHFNLDIIKFSLDHMCLIITGFFEDHGPVHNTLLYPRLRRYSRNIVLKPPSGVHPTRIYSEHINLRTASEEQCRQIAFNKYQLGSPLSSAGITTRFKCRIPQILATYSIELEEEEKSLVEKLALETQLHSQWSRRILAESNWDYNQSLLAFKALRMQEKIPPEAFTQAPMAIEQQP